MNNIYLSTEIIILALKININHYTDIVLSLGISLLYSFIFLIFIDDEDVSIIIDAVFPIIVVSLLFFF